jgi:hypothetical protein
MTDHNTDVSIEERSDLTELLPEEGDENTFEAHFDGRPASIAIIESLAAIERVPPEKVDFTLYETLDPDSLDSLFGEDGTGRDLVATFSVSNYRVQIRDGGRIKIESFDATD